MQLKSGAILQGGRYRIVDSLGRGGFGVTYLAEQVMAKRRVCIKEFFPKDYYKRDGDTGELTLSSDGFGEMMGKFKAKFVKEAQTIATLNHANIIPIHDVFEENGTAYYVMDYIEGESLSERVKRGGAMSERDAVAYIRQVASALGYIHERTINHLDVKPGNIMVRKEDNRAILIDFGLSKHYDENSGEATSTTPVGVSHGYAPIEQYKQGGVNRFSPETDIYSLGATLYYIATGIVPPHAADMGKDGIGELPSELSSGVCSAIRKSMNYWKEDRPHTIKEFLTLLDNDEPIVTALADESEKTKIAPHKPSPKRRSNEEKPKQKRSRWWLWLVIIFATAGGIYYGIGKNMQSKGKGFYGVYDVGDYFNRDGKEGVVFEVSDGGRHGKIVSLDEAELVWDSRVEVIDGYKYINGTKTGANSLSDGKANTAKIMSCTDSQYFEACVWCRNKGADWYLPAVDELKAIYNNKSAIYSTLAEYGTIDDDRAYWSSTEDEDNPGFCALSVGMSSGRTYSGTNKSRNYIVRAVSDF